jgi:hypothetical protein
VQFTVHELRNKNFRESNTIFLKGGGLIISTINNDKLLKVVTGKADLDLADMDRKNARDPRPRDYSLSSLGGSCI